jgi:hypothetical protein
MSDFGGQSEMTGSSDDDTPEPPKASLSDFKATVNRKAEYVFPLFQKGQSARRATVSQFHGKVRIDIREYYLEDDEWKPGRKGISLDLAQWRELLKVAPLIDEATDALS